MSIQFVSVQDANSWNVGTPLTKKTTSTSSQFSTSSLPSDSNRPLPEEFLPASSKQWAVPQQDLSLKKPENTLPSSTTPILPEEELQPQSLYKTELCRSFEETGACRYGSKCQFAHGREELRPVARHPKYKTEICKTFHSIGTCPYGKRCRFIHNSADVLNNSSSSWANNWPSNDANPTPATLPPTDHAVPTVSLEEEENETEQDEPVGQGHGRRLAVFESLCSISSEEH